MIFYLIAIIFVFVLLLLTVFGSLIYFGIFESIEVSTGPTPYTFANRQIAYRLGKGKCDESSSIFTEICSIIPDRPTIGMYLQQSNKGNYHQMTDFNPVSDKFDFLVGAFVTEGPQNDSLINDEERKLLELKGYKFCELPSVENVVHSKFPFRGIMSVVVAVRRVYPAINQYIKEHRLCAYPGIEIYDRDSIYFIFPLSQQGTFVSLIKVPDTESENVQDDDDDDEDNVEEAETASSSNSSFEDIASEDIANEDIN